jgi:hypothetical protein
MEDGMRMDWTAYELPEMKTQSFMMTTHQTLSRRQPLFPIINRYGILISSDAFLQSSLGPMGLYMTVKKATRTGKVIDINEIAKIKEARTAKLKKLQEVRAIARKMGINTRNVTLKELIRAIQRAEGNKDCYMTAQVLTCGQVNCCWREVCTPF